MNSFIKMKRSTERLDAVGASAIGVDPDAVGVTLLQHQQFDERIAVLLARVERGVRVAGPGGMDIEELFFNGN